MMPPQRDDPLPQSSPQSSGGEIQRIDSIIKTIIPGLLELIPRLHKFISPVKDSLPEPEVQSDHEAGEKEIEVDDDDRGGTVRCCSSRFSGDKRGFGSKKAESARNGCSSGANGGRGDRGKSKEGVNVSAISRWSNFTPQDLSEKFRRDLNYIKRALTKFSDLEEGFYSQFKDIEEQCRLLDQMIQIPTNMTQDQRSTTATSSQQVLDQFRSISDMVTHLKLHIPSLHELSTSNTGAHQSDAGIAFNAYYIVGKMPRQDMKTKVWGAPAFEEFLDDLMCVFEYLDRRSKLCLLCLSVFPENAVLRKRLLVNWWIGEGLVDPGEEGVDAIFKEFIAKGFVEPVLKKRKVIGFKIDPLVRFVLIAIAEKLEFCNFNPMGVPTEDFSRSYRACLVRREKESCREILIKNENNLHKLRTIFNVNDPYPDFKLDWFSKLKNLNVLYLGNWQAHHVEVGRTKFLKGLKHMKHLQFLSLQGMLGITELPDCICNLTSLKILDLNACCNLIRLSTKIDALKKLTHLDISQCYLLLSIPIEISSLKELQVLKGFVIGDSNNSDSNTSGSNNFDLNTFDSCPFGELKELSKLRKLSLYTRREDFPTHNELIVLQGFKKLEKLTIAWLGKPHQGEQYKNSEQLNSSPNPGDTRGLQKLELHCFPGTAAPAWLVEGKLKPQNSLHLSGGNLKRLGMITNQRISWKVKILRLKFLSELKMDWGDLQKSFPELIYLEKVRCPKLTFFPCDEHGVWLNGKMEAEQMEESGLGLSWSFLKRKSYPPFFFHL